LSVPNDYVISKRLLTRFIDSYKLNFSILHFIIPTVYGKGENDNRLLPYLLKCKTLKKDIHLTAGHQLREYLYIEELPIIINKAILLNIESGIYNVEGSDRIKIQELVALAAKIFSIAPDDIHFSSVDRWDTSMNVLMLNGEKLNSKLNYKAVYTLNETIKKYLD
jgi:nucleoside-diphosphate-sugar epimerase